MEASSGTAAVRAVITADTSSAFAQPGPLAPLVTRMAASWATRSGSLTPVFARQ